MFVSVQDVEKTYFPRNRPPIPALKSTKLDIGEGEFVAIVGPSGCGKSTLLSILAGLEAPTSGTVVVDGTPLTAPYPDLGMAFQRDLLLEWRTVLDNVLLQVEVRREDRRAYVDRARELIEQVGLVGFADRYPGELSGGMRQRVSLCRALLREPRLLLMDEPFGALDALTRDQMALDVQDIVTRGSRTAVLVTHSVAEAVFMADRVLVFSPRPGQIVESIEIDLPRPRRLVDREQPRFNDYVARVMEIFVSQGTLRER